MRPLLALALLLLLAACSKPDRSRPSPVASSVLPPGTTQPRKPAPRPLPPAIASLRAEAIERARGLLPEAEALEKAVASRDVDAARKHYRELRRRDRELLPVTREMARAASSQMGSAGSQEREEASPHAGFRPLFEALSAEPPRWDDAAKSAALLRAAARLMPTELEMQDWTLERAARAVSEGVFAFGQRLDGSEAGSPDERVADARAEAAGVAWAALAFRDAVHAVDERAAQGVDDEVGRVHQFLMELRDEPRGLLSLLGTTGRLGAAVRRAASRLGAGPVPPPFPPRGAKGDPSLSAVSAASFPALPGGDPDPKLARLGEQLFASALLSRNRQVSCASCHDPAQAFARADPPALTFDRKIPARNAPGLRNVGYEPLFFWDARASTLEAQIELAVDRDMGGDWAEIERRIGESAPLARGFDEAFGKPADAALVKKAIVAFERSLVADTTPLDRFARGDEKAMSDLELRGFDLYFGKARCSRCHLLPLTSGTSAPRFLFTETSSIGVPKGPGKKAPDPDAGRFESSKRPGDRGMFKVPSLRDLDRTAPYFHNGSFKTLEQVVEFYEKGGGPGLGYPVPNVDPDLAPFSLAPAEREALLAFLRTGLASR